jgi:peptide deformylase
MIYPIHVYGMPVLRKRGVDIDEDYEGLEQLIEDMFETMFQSDGIGLAAHQIGKAIRLIVIDGSRIEDEDEENELKDFKRILINAEIVEESGEEWEFNEGCLSIPGIREDVKRKPEILLRYQDEHFKQHEERFDGVKARVIQHEMDHINGILFTDRILPLRKRLLNGKLRSISKGQTEATYAIRFPRK